MPHRSNRALTVAAVLLCMFMSAMEATVVATAMPTVVADLAGIELYGWVGAIYMLAVTVTIPTWGKLADVWGRRPVLLAGLALFLAGSLGSGLAGSMHGLIAMRAIQGLGAGAMQPVSLTIVGDLFTIEERGRMQGLFGAVWGVSAMAGPLLGGLIVSAMSWRWVFFLNLPVGLLCAAMLVLFYRDPAREAGPRKRLDLLGASVLSAAVLLLLVGVGGQAAWIALPLSTALVVLFVWVEARAEDPIVPLPLLARPLIRMGTISGALMGAVMMGVLVYTPLFAQAALGRSPTEAGTAVAPMLVGWPIASALSGRILPKLGFRVLVRVGLGLVLAGAIALRLELAHGLWAVRAASFLLGSGMGLANTALILAVHESVSHGERGVATAATIFSRSMGGAVAVGALGALTATMLRGEIPAEVLNRLLAPGDSALEAGLRAGYEASIARGMTPVFTVILGLAALTAVSGLWFPDAPLPAKRAGSGLASGG